MRRAVLVVGRVPKRAIDDLVTYLVEEKKLQPDLVRIDFNNVTDMLQTMSVDLGLELFDLEAADEFDLGDDLDFEADPEMVDEADVLWASNAVQLSEIFREVVGRCPEEFAAVIWRSIDSPVDPVDFGILDDALHVLVLANGKLMMAFPEDPTDD